jgi:hypothetical protein
MRRRGGAVCPNVCVKLAEAKSSAGADRRRVEARGVRDHQARFGPARGRCWLVSVRACLDGSWMILERDKGVRWMPWRQEAMKDVARCEKPRGDASDR